MGCLGVHFAITPDEAAKLKSFEKDSDRLDYLQSELESNYFENHPELMAESDKAWDAMHRLLSDGDLSYTTGPTPLRFTVIGGEPLYAQDDYIMSLKTPEEAKLVALALTPITKEIFREKYDALDASKYDCPKSEEDFEYTWEWFQGVVTLYQKAASEGRYVLFTASQ